MIKFKTVTLRERTVDRTGTVEGDPARVRHFIEVSGPVDVDPATVKHLIFIIGQDGASADAHARDWSKEGWNGEVEAEGFTTGPAQGVGLAVMLTQGAPTSYETFTWAQQVEITGTEAGS